jgi:hypothetical protein
MKISNISQKLSTFFSRENKKRREEQGQLFRLLFRCIITRHISVVGVDKTAVETFLFVGSLIFIDGIDSVCAVSFHYVDLTKHRMWLDGYFALFFVHHKCAKKTPFKLFL